MAAILLLPDKFALSQPMGSRKPSAAALMPRMWDPIEHELVNQDADVTLVFV